MNRVMSIGRRRIGEGQPVYVVAEMSANHNQRLEHAIRIIEEARRAGADAIKLQTYTADTMTLDCDSEHFQVKGTIWEGRKLHDLYREATTPWEWHGTLKDVATEVGLDWFSTPFDATAVDFLERLGAPAYKIASFEVTDVPLIRRVAATGKPVIVSTGMATLDEITEAVRTLRGAGAREIALLKCTSAYPARPEDMHLRTIADMTSRFDVAVGLSDHSMDTDVPVLAVALGACLIEKHFTLSRSVPGPDSAFSLEPPEFRRMVDAVRTAERALGTVRYEASASEQATKVFRRSLFVVRDVKCGEVFTTANVRCIRPAHGLHPRHLEEVLGRRATRDVAKGTPLGWDMVSAD